METAEHRTEQRAVIFEEIMLESSSGKRLSRISDMSLGGCYIESITQFTVGEAVAFELDNPNGGKLRFVGKVAYVLEGFGFGMEFNDLDNEKMAFLRSKISPGE